MSEISEKDRKLIKKVSKKAREILQKHVIDLREQLIKELGSESESLDEKTIKIIVNNTIRRKLHSNDVQNEITNNNKQ